MTNEWMLLQLIDSASPTGAFSHSFGLETAAKERKLRSKDDLFEWMTVFIDGSLAPIEGKAVFIAYEAMKATLTGEVTPDEFELRIKKLDQRLFFSKIPSETREASRKIGKRFLKNVMTLYPESGLEQYEAWINQGECFGSSAIVHGWIAAYLDVDLPITVFTFLYNSINSLLQSAIRLNIVGQTDVQLILRDLYPYLKNKADDIVVEGPSISDLRTYSIVLEIESMRHETLYSRLFMS